MMKILTALAGVTAVCLLFTFLSCNSGNGVILKSKADSLRVAQAYFNKYPDESTVKTKYQSADSVISKGVMPITWLQVENYTANYDKRPFIFSPDGTALKGFQVDSAGYSMILSNKNIKGVYLRLGRKDDGAFTIMLLGTDIKGLVIKDSGFVNQGGMGTYGNFDNVLPCPTNCPRNFE